MTGPNGTGHRQRDLSALRRIIGEFRLVESGRFHALRSPSVRHLGMLDGYADQPMGKQVQMALDFVSACMPTASREEIDELDARQLIAMMEMAVDPAAAMQKYADEMEGDPDPNGPVETPPHPATSPLTPLATSATGSQNVQVAASGG